MHRAMQVGAAVLLEGAQGSLLDIDHGTYPFVTSSNTTSGGAAVGVGIAPTAIDARARRGEGVHDARRQRPAAHRARRAARQSEVRKLGNEFGATTGRPRRCGWFDARRRAVRGARERADRTSP